MRSLSSDVQVRSAGESVGGGNAADAAPMGGFASTGRRRRDPLSPHTRKKFLGTEL